MSDKKRNIVVQLKGAAKPVSSDYMDAEEAERLLKEEVVPKIGTDDSIVLPGLVVNAKEVISAKANWPAAVAVPRVAPRGRSIRDQRF
jgi:hypothetical protein